MNREDFLFGLREQYAEQIREAYVECEHDSGRVVDFNKLHDQLLKLLKTAQFSGLPEKEFLDLVRTELPDAWERLKFLSLKKSA